MRAFFTLLLVLCVFLKPHACHSERARARVAGQQVQINTQYDRWQLSTFVHEVSTDKPYWPRNVLHEQILNVLIRGNAHLPNQERPVLQDLQVSSILQRQIITVS
jgi:hypothetical protein